MRLVSKIVRERVRALTSMTLSVRMAETNIMRRLVVPCVVTAADVKVRSLCV